MRRVALQTVRDENRHEIGASQGREALKTAKPDVAVGKASEDRATRGAGLIAALKGLAGFYQGERPGGGRPERLKHGRRQNLAHAALEGQTPVAGPGPGCLPRALGSQIEEAAGPALPQLSEQEASPIAEVRIVGAELVAVVAHRQRRGLIARQGFEAGEVGQPFRIRERGQPHGFSG